jgi:hypothetical protein
VSSAGSSDEAKCCLPTLEQWAAYVTQVHKKTANSAACSLSRSFQNSQRKPYEIRNFLREKMLVGKSKIFVTINNLIVPTDKLPKSSRN